MHFCLNHLNAPTDIKHIGMWMGKTKAPGAWWQSWNAYMLFTATWVLHGYNPGCSPSSACCPFRHSSCVDRLCASGRIIALWYQKLSHGKYWSPQKSHQHAQPITGEYVCSYPGVSTFWMLPHSFSCGPLCPDAPTRGTYASSPSELFPSPPAQLLAPSTSAETLLSCAAFGNLSVTEW